MARMFRTILTVATLAGALVCGPELRAADFPYEAEPVGPASPRFFPRGDGSDLALAYPAPRRRVVTCAPRWVPIPTNAPDDPSYVGSPYGLGKPSYYGFRPPLGHDDPSSRPLAYCP